MRPIPADRCPYPYRVTDDGFVLREEIDRVLDSLPADAAAELRNGVCRRATAEGDHVALCPWHRYGRKSAADLVGTEGGDGTVGPLNGANLRADIGDEVSFADRRLIGGDFAGGSFRDADFSGAELVGARFYSAVTGAGADLAGADLSNADLRHADLRHTNLRGADLSGANLNNARLTGAQLDGTDLTGAQLIQVSASETRFVDASLTDSDLWNATLSDARLTRADFTDATLRMATLRGVHAENATFARTNFARANLSDSRTAGALFRDALITTETALTDDTDRSVYEKEADRSLLSGSDWRPDSPHGGGSGALSGAANSIRRFGRRLRRSEERDPNRLSKAIDSYRTYQRLFRENDLHEQIPRYRTREKHAKRKRSLSRGGLATSDGRRNLLGWTRLSLARWTILYGESPWRVGLASLVVVTAFALVYPLWGIEVGQGVADYTVAPSELPDVFLTAIYFSFSKFVSVTPAVATGVGPVRLLAAIEAFLGTFLLALLVFVLGRRMTW